MGSIVTISEAASIGLHAMIVLAARTERPHATRAVAEQMRVSEAHLSKVFQRLARAGLVKSVRGPKGGFVLGRGAEAVSLLEVYEAIEGPTTRPSCLLPRPICGGSGCLVDRLFDQVDRFCRQLAETTLAEASLGLPASWGREGGCEGGGEADR